jgi:aromatic-amino-acid transaminase
MKATVRRNYSSPRHARRRHRERACSATPALRAAWQADVDGMRTRIQAMRRLTARGARRQAAGPRGRLLPQPSST